MTMDYSKLNIPALKALCKERNITGYSKLSKQGLIDKLLATPSTSSSTEAIKDVVATPPVDNTSFDPNVAGTIPPVAQSIGDPPNSIDTEPALDAGSRNKKRKKKGEPSGEELRAKKPKKPRVTKSAKTNQDVTFSTATLNQSIQKKSPASTTSPGSTPSETQRNNTNTGVDHDDATPSSTIPPSNNMTSTGGVDRSESSQVQRKRSHETKNVSGGGSSGHSVAQPSTQFSTGANFISPTSLKFSQAPFDKEVIVMTPPKTSVRMKPPFKAPAAKLLVRASPIDATALITPTSAALKPLTSKSINPPKTSLLPKSKAFIRHNPKRLPTTNSPVLLKSNEGEAFSNNGPLETHNTATLYHLDFPASFGEPIAARNIDHPPKLSQRNLTNRLSVILMFLSNADRRNCALVSKAWRYAGMLLTRFSEIGLLNPVGLVYLSAQPILQRYFAGARLDHYLSHYKKTSLSQLDVWPYLCQRQHEDDERRATYSTCFLFRSSLAMHPVTRRLWASPDHPQQIVVALR